MKRRATDILAALLLALLAGVASGGEIGLSWDQSALATGYRAYVSQSSGSYDAPAWDGTSTTTTVQATGGCVQNFAVVTAYNAGGESGASDEVSFTTRPVVGAIATGPSTWLLTGDGFTPGLELFIYTVADPTVPLGVPHTVQDCGSVTIPVTSIPGSPDYFKLRICTNGGLVCLDYLLVPAPPGNVAVF